MSPLHAPPLVTWGIAILAVLLALLFVAAQRTAGRNLGYAGPAVRRRTALAASVVSLWMLGCGLAAATGLLARFEARPPPLLLALAASLVAAFGYALSPAGKRLAVGLPLAALVGVQSFRLPLELVMHEAARAGVMPPQMTWTGWNLDVLTGATAVLLAPAIASGAAPRWLVSAWNVIGLALVLGVLGIGIASTPAIRAFGDGAQNTWIAWFPFIWLPTVLVPAAIGGHLLVLRRSAA
jgi:hypothetical protein